MHLRRWAVRNRGQIKPQSTDNEPYARKNNCQFFKCNSTYNPVWQFLLTIKSLQAMFLYSLQEHPAFFDIYA